MENLWVSLQPAPLGTPKTQPGPSEDCQFHQKCEQLARHGMLGLAPSDCLTWGGWLGSGLTRAVCHCLSSDSFLGMSNHHSDVTSQHLNLSEIRRGGKQGPLLLRAEQRVERGADPAARTQQVTGVSCPAGSPGQPWASASPRGALLPPETSHTGLSAAPKVPHCGNERFLFLLPALSPDFYLGNELMAINQESLINTRLE